MSFAIRARILVPMLGLAVAIGCMRALRRIDASVGGPNFERRGLGRHYLQLLVAFLVCLTLFAVAARIDSGALGTLAGIAPVDGLLLILMAVVRLEHRPRTSGPMT